MSSLINRISTDHEHLLRLLECLDFEVSGYREDSQHTPKLSIILDALDYLHNYPDSFHHPLESRLLSRLRPRLSDAEARSIFEQIEVEHEEIGILTTRLINTFKNIEQDQVVPVNQLLSDCQRYSELQRQHIRKENRVMLPAMKEYLEESDYELVEEALKENPDPLFGSHVWESYEALYQHILQSQSESV